MRSSLSVLTVLLLAECWTFLAWAFSSALASNLGSFTSIRSVPTAFERLLSRTPPAFLVLFGRQLPANRAWTPAMLELHARTSRNARTVDRAQDAAFTIPALAGWVLVLIAIMLFAVTAGLPEAGVSRWLIPGFFLLMNFATLFTVLGLKQRAWTLRAPFDWRLYRLLTVHRFHIARAVARRQPTPVVEELAVAGARQIEQLLRLRFLLSGTGESDRVAARTWEHHISPLIVARASRVLDPSTGSPEAWFASWTEDVAVAASGDTIAVTDETRDIPPMSVETPAHRSILSVSLTLFVVASVGLAVTAISPEAVGAFRWKDYIGIPAAAVAIITCGKYVTELRRRRAGGLG